MNEIILVKASNIYSFLILENGTSLLASENISSIESKLTTGYFYRTHRSYLINMHFISTVSVGDKKIIMKGYAQPVPIARDKSKDFSQQLITLFATY